ncbi:MAG: immune inhibitor A [Candidatus Kerfeldbacteria bacterium]|nr:immune inhibitor A [Candidatus Kerfeldbacteria bacterium]
MKKQVWLGLVIGLAVLAFKQPAQAGTLFFDEMEIDDGSWTATGLWHQQTNPENISIADDINPALVSLPDFGFLPNAYSGEGVWWYGSASDGTFLGDWTLADQDAKNGGWSNLANDGELISPAIDLTTSENATLTFWNWWEIEGVDVDQYDLMSVYITTDGGATWSAVVNLNPLNDVDGESWKPFSSGGLGQVGQWIHTQADLSDYVGNTIQLKFYFETVDQKYNGFRGWLIDDVRVTNDITVKPSFDSQTAQASASCGGDSGGEIATPAQLYLYRSQQVQVTSAGDWYITPFGSNDYVASGVAGINSGIFLNAGYFVLWVTLPEGQTCPDALPVTGTASFYGGPGQAIAYPGGLVYVYGSDFVSNSTAQFIPGSSSTAVQTVIDADATIVVSSTEIQISVPYSLTDGEYGLRVTTPSGKKTTLANAITISTDTPPDIAMVSPEAVDDTADTAITITGTGFVDGAMAVIGGVPLTDVAVTETTITGTLLAGAAGGFQNVDVINPDGQKAELIGGVSVQDNGTTAYLPSGSMLTAPNKVKGVTVSNVTAKTAKVRWNAVTGSDHYVVQVKRGSTVTKTVTTTKTNTKVKGLKSGKHYKVQVRAVGNYLGGAYSKKIPFQTAG